MLGYKQENKIAFGAIGDTKFQGFLEEYMNRLFQHRIFSDFGKEQAYMEAEDALRYPHDDDTVVGYWSGEFWGKLVISACRVAQYTGSEDLKQFLQAGALRVVSLAREDGYINSYADSDNIFPAPQEEVIKELGKECDWNWNIWCRKYTLWGLVECADLTGDARILQGACRLAKQLIHQLKDNNIRLGSTGTTNFCGLPPGSILKPMLILYRMTGDTDFLDFSVEIGEDWDREDGLRPNLVRNGLSNTPVHTWYPHSELWAKAYEMMSCLDGLLELYRVTGEEKYFCAVRNIYDQLKKYEGNVLFSVGFNDIFANAAKYQNVLSEPCDVIHWMRLGSELFALTGDIKYMNEMEQSFYNAYVASVEDAGTWSARCVRTSGRHFRAEPQSFTKYNHCCLDNLPRGYINMVQAAVMTDGESIWLNHYCPLVSHAAVGDAATTVTVGDGYLQTSKVRITVEAEAPVTLRLRIPAVAGENASITGIGAVTPNSYASVSLPKGKTMLEANFDFRAVIHEFPEEMPSLPEEDFRIKRWREQYLPEQTMPLDSMTKERCAYVTYGPLILTQSKKLGATEEQMFDFETICEKGYTAKAKAIPCNDSTVLAAFRVTFANGSDSFTRDMCAYATASDNFNNFDEKFFQMYL